MASCRRLTPAASGCSNLNAAPMQTWSHRTTRSGHAPPRSRSTGPSLLPPAVSRGCAAIRGHTERPRMAGRALPHWCPAPVLAIGSEGASSPVSCRFGLPSRRRFVHKYGRTHRRQAWPTALNTLSRQERPAERAPSRHATRSAGSARRPAPPAIPLRCVPVMSHPVRRCRLGR